LISNGFLHQIQAPDINLSAEQLRERLSQATDNEQARLIAINVHKEINITTRCVISTRD